MGTHFIMIVYALRPHLEETESSNKNQCLVYLSCATGLYMYIKHSHTNTQRRMCISTFRKIDILKNHSRSFYKEFYFSHAINICIFALEVMIT